MKIVMITASDLSIPHGPVIHFMELAKTLAKKGHGVTVVAPALGIYGGEAGFCVKYLPVVCRTRTVTRMIFQIQLVLWLARHLRSFDAVYTRLSFLMITPPWIAKILRVKHATEVNGNLFRDRELRKLPKILNIYLWLLQKNAYACSFRIFALTEGLSKHIQSVFSCPKEKMSVIGVGVDIEMFSPAPVAEARTKLSLDPETIKYIGFTGTLDAWQGVQLLLMAGQKLARIYDPFKIIIVGFGQMRELYQHQAKELGIGDRVIFTGRIAHEKIADYIRAFDICVIPRAGIEEGYAPIKLLEYLACGRPVVASRIKGFEMLETRKCGLTYEEGNAESLCQALLKGLEDKILWNTLRMNAREVAVEKHSWDHVARRVLEALE